jgi:predicted kinase
MRPMFAPQLSLHETPSLLPADLPSGRSLFVLTGLPGTGKSWLSETLAVLAGVRPICLDQLRERLFPLAQVGPGGKYTPEASRSTYEAAQESARRQLEAGGPAILDGTFLMKSGRTQIRELARQVGADLLFIKVTAPDGVVADRLQNRVAGQDHGSEAGLDVYRSMVDQVATGRLGMIDIEADVEGFDDPSGLIVVDTHHRQVHMRLDSPLARTTASWLTRDNYQQIAS